MSFDDVASGYGDKVADALPGGRHGAYLRAKVGKLIELTRRAGLRPDSCRLADVGCGIGLMAELLAPRFAALDGVDISARSIEAARRRVPGARFSSYPGGRLPFDDELFDVTVAVCVVHHIPPAEWTDFAAEMARITRSGGLIAVFEHNPLNPMTRWVVSRCEFDADAVLLGRRQTEALFRGQDLEPRSEFILLTPWRDALSRRAERALAALPFGAQYVTSAIKPAAAQGH